MRIRLSIERAMTMNVRSQLKRGRKSNRDSVRSRSGVSLAAPCRSEPFAAISTLIQLKLSTTSFLFSQTFL